jgi:hypothetical protein
MPIISYFLAEICILEFAMGLVSQICPSKNYKLLTSAVVNSKMHILAAKEDINTNPSVVSLVFRVEPKRASLIAW